jgi:hypothetical protein
MSKINFWSKNNFHVRNNESKFEQEIKAMPLNHTPQIGVIFDNSRIQQPITPGNIKLSNPFINPENYNRFSSTFPPNIKYDKPMPLNKCNLAYSTY